MQWASLWPSSVIKTGVSLAAQSALFRHPARAPGTPWLPAFSIRAFVCPLGLPVTASFTRSLARLPPPPFSSALSAAGGLRAPLAPSAHSSGLDFPFASLAYFGHSPRSALASLALFPLARTKVRGLFKPVFRFFHLALDFGY